MTEALWLIIKAVGSLLATACVLRFVAWRVHMSPRNPLAQFIVAITDWIVKPIQRVLPPTRNADWASLAAALVLSVIVSIAFSLLYMGGRAPAFGRVVLFAVFWLCQWSIYLLIALLILQAVLSWVNPHAPLAPAVNLLTDPFLAPVRKVIPLVGGVDLSPLVVILVAQVALTLLDSVFAWLVALQI